MSKFALFSTLKVTDLLDQLSDCLFGGKSGELSDYGNQFTGNCYMLNLPHLSHEKC